MVEQNTRNFAKLKYNLQAKVGFDLTQQDSRKKRTAKRLSVTNVTGLLLACFVVIFHYINVSWSVFYKKILFEGEAIKDESFFKQNYCHARHTRFPVFFPLPSCCVSSLILIRFRRFLKNLQVIMTTILKSFRALSTIVMLQGLFLCILETSQICDLDLHSTNKLQCSSPSVTLPPPRF